MFYPVSRNSRRASSTAPSAAALLSAVCSKLAQEAEMRAYQFAILYTHLKLCPLAISGTTGPLLMYAKSNTAAIVYQSCRCRAA